MAKLESCWVMIAHGPPAECHDDADRGTDEGRHHHAELEAAEAHASREKRRLRRPERGHEEAQRERREQRAHLGLAVERCDRSGEEDPEGCEQEPGADAEPERGRAVVLGDIPALDESGSEAEVREHVDQPGEHDDHGCDPVVRRSEEPREDDRDHDSRGLKCHLGDRLPGEASQDERANGRRCRDLDGHRTVTWPSAESSYERE